MTKHKRLNKTNLITLIIGFVLLLASIFIYSFDIQGFWREVHSEMFAIGCIVFLTALSFIIFKVRIKIG